MLDMDGVDPQPESGLHGDEDLAAFEGEAARFKRRRKARAKKKGWMPRHLALWIMLAVLLAVMVWVTWEKVGGPSPLGLAGGYGAGVRSST